MEEACVYSLGELDKSAVLLRRLNWRPGYKVASRWPGAR